MHDRDVDTDGVVGLRLGLGRGLGLRMLICGCGCKSTHATWHQQKKQQLRGFTRFWAKAAALAGCVAAADIIVARSACLVMKCIYNKWI